MDNSATPVQAVSEGLNSVESFAGKKLKGVAKGFQKD